MGPLQSIMTEKAVFFVVPTPGCTRYDSEAKKYNGDAGVDVANLEVVHTQVWGPRRCKAHAGELLARQQGNCDDCGVFTCIFANYVSAALPFAFTAATSVGASPSAY